MGATHQITDQTKLDKKGIQENMAGFNWQSDPNMIRKPDYFIYMFNVGAKSHEVCRPPQMPRVQIPGIKPGEKFRMAFKIPNTVNQMWADPDNGSPRIHGEHGERVAMDMINPNNLGIDQDAEIDQSKVLSAGNDLSKYGVFWSRNEVPTELELTAARKRMEKFYRELLRRADQLATNGKRDEITDDMHMAADYFQYQAAWHVQVEVPLACPQCGENIKQGVAYHKNSMDVICVIDWKRTVASGAKKKEEVPEELRWWGKEKAQ